MNGLVHTRSPKTPSEYPKIGSVFLEEPVTEPADTTVPSSSAPAETKTSPPTDRRVLIAVIAGLLGVVLALIVALVVAMHHRGTTATPTEVNRQELIAALCGSNPQQDRSGEGGSTVGLACGPHGSDTGFLFFYADPGALQAEIANLNCQVGHDIEGPGWLAHQVTNTNAVAALVDLGGTILC